MSERKRRPTRPLSRETAYLMLQMKDLLRKHGVNISLAAPNVYDQLLQAAEAVDDEEVGQLYLRIIDDAPPVTLPAANDIAFDEENPFIEDEASPFADEPSHAKPAAPRPTKPRAQDRSAAASKHDPDPTHKIVLPKQFVAEAEGGARSKPGDRPEPVTKRVAMHTPRAGLLRCDECQRTNTVIASASEEETREIQCVCGMVYRVILDARQYDRKDAHLSGSYLDPNDSDRTGPIVIENISFGGLKFRVVGPHSMAYNDFLDIQFTLNNAAQTPIREKVRVTYVRDDMVGAEFAELNALSRELAVYLVR